MSLVAGNSGLRSPRSTIRANTRKSPTAYGFWSKLTRSTACCSTTSPAVSLTGRTTDALGRLRRAIDMSEEFRGHAKRDSDLDPIRDQPAFRQLISD
jgi:hypothetical protein